MEILFTRKRVKYTICIWDSINFNKLLEQIEHEATPLSEGDTFRFKNTIDTGDGKITSKSRKCLIHSMDKNIIHSFVI